jgi:N-acetylneuraminic acid mutarotase
LLKTYAASGTCSGGACSYASTNETCPFGCTNGACNADPCIGVVCDSPPPDQCAPGSVTLVQSSGGKCNAFGNCQYDKTYVTCKGECVVDACEPYGLWKMMAPAPTMVTSPTTGARARHTAVWTGTEMLVWGGTDFTGPFATGARYNPVTDHWNPMSNGPAMYDHTAVWTGTEMLVWGGWAGNVPASALGRYNPTTYTWDSVPYSDGPAPRAQHTAVWTGSEMIVFGGIVFGPLQNTYQNTGGRFDPQTSTWKLLPTTGAPTRADHTAVWTGTEMIVWGGVDGTATAPTTGARYNPQTNTWTPMSTVGAPAGRHRHAAVWSGTEMIVWGGGAAGGGRYNPTTDTWTALPTTGAPDAPWDLTAVWTGSEMIVWGGGGGSLVYGNGARFNPAANAWLPLPTPGMPAPRTSHTAVWTGSEMIVWGGQTASGQPTATGGRYSLP